MPYYAITDMIGEDPIEGGIEITEEQALDAISKIIAGWKVTVIDGVLIMVPPSDPEPEMPVENPTALAVIALEVTDSVAIRCFKAGIPFPLEWKTYTATLRAIVNGSTEDLPEQPEYPEEALSYEPQ